jgi:hypothetical protein
VVVVDHDAAGAADVAASLPGPALAVKADVSVEQDVQQALERAVERFGRVDLHHLNAGISGSLAPFEELTVADFDQVIDVNLRGVFLGLRAAFRQYAQQEGGGAIVTTASIGSLRGSADLVPYHTAKHGVLGLTRCAAVHGAELGVHCRGKEGVEVCGAVERSCSVPASQIRDVPLVVALTDRVSARVGVSHVPARHIAPPHPGALLPEALPPRPLAARLVARTCRRANPDGESPRARPPCSPLQP